jgi:large subunit ribosomal protein L6
MSRIGKLPISIPSGVTITITGQTVAVKGAKGELKRDLPAKVKVEQKEQTIVVTPIDESTAACAMWGLSRTLVANMIEGVTAGFVKDLEIKGVGYKSALKGKDLELALGFSHPVLVKAPDGITFEVDPKKNTIKVSGINKEVVGQTAANIRSFRPPEPYKGKGVMYAGEHIIRKAGKTAGK